jgi:hypothetical protein
MFAAESVVLRTPVTYTSKTAGQFAHVAIVASAGDRTIGI